LVLIENVESEARLDLPPRNDARLHLPESFGTRFALFGDAEEEFDWNGPFRRESTATDTIRALPEANRRFQAVGLEPCWMVDWPVVDNADSGAILRELVAGGDCTIGTQLHPWVSPPFDEDVSRRNSFTCNLSRDLQREKLMRVYRAGRYGIGPHTAALLGEFGYALDVSVRSCFDYRSQGGPDFSRHPLWPWKVAHDLYELPLTTAYTGSLGRWPAFYRAESLRGTLARTGLLARVPLTPEGVPLADALEAIETLLGEGHRLFSLSFHTPSLVPGNTPYVRDAADLETFWRWWDGVFERFASRGVTAVGADAIIDAFRAADGKPA
jgi:hypothetical protein